MKDEAGDDGVPTEQLDVKLEDLVTEVERLKRLLDEGEDLALDDKLEDLQTELAALKDENAELKSYFEEALQEAERLKDENESLRAAQQEALLQAQLERARSEEERSQLVNAHDKARLEERLREVEAKGAELERQLKAAEDENDVLTTEVGKAHKASQDVGRELEKERQKAKRLEEDVTQLELLRVENRRLRALEDSAREVERLRSENETLKRSASLSNGLASAASGGGGGSKPPSTPVGRAASTDGSSAAVGGSVMGVEELEASKARRDELLAKLEGGADGGPPAGLDPELRSSLLAALKDQQGLEATAAAAKKEQERLRTELQDLNDTVFSKSFKPPSAWSEREVKYKMEKKAWDQEEKKLRNRIASVLAENQAFREANKSQEYEAKIQELQQLVDKALQEKAAAQHEVHELRIEMQNVHGEFVGNADAGKHRHDFLRETQSTSDPGSPRPGLPTVGSSSSLGRPPKPIATRAVATAPAAAQGADVSTPASDAKIAAAIQQFNAQGIGAAQLQPILAHYSLGAASAAASGAASSGEAPPPPEGVSSPAFRQVLAALQAQGVGPEAVSSYLERQKEISAGSTPSHSRHTSGAAAGAMFSGGAAGADEEPSAPRFAEMQSHFEGLGISEVQLQSLLRAYVGAGGGPSAAAGPAGTSAALPSTLPDADVLQSKEFSQVRAYLEAQGMRPEDMRAYLSRMQEGDASATATAGPADASWRPVPEADVRTLAGFSEVVAHFLSLGVPRDRLNAILGGYLATSSAKGSAEAAQEALEALPEDVRSGPHFQNIVDYLRSASVPSSVVSDFLRRDVNSSGGATAAAATQGRGPDVNSSGGGSAATAAAEGVAAGAGGGVAGVGGVGGPAAGAAVGTGLGGAGDDGGDDGPATAGEHMEVLLAAQGVAPDQARLLLRRYVEEEQPGAGKRQEVGALLQEQGVDPGTLRAYLFDSPSPGEGDAPVSPRYAAILERCAALGLGPEDVYEALEAEVAAADAAAATAADGAASTAAEGGEGEGGQQLPGGHGPGYESLARELRQQGIGADQVRQFLRQDTGGLGSRSTSSAAASAAAAGGSRATTPPLAAGPAASDKVALHIRMPEEQQERVAFSINLLANAGGAGGCMADGGGAAQQQHHLTSERVQELKSDPELLRELAERADELPPSERLLVLQLKEASDLEAQCGLLQRQVAKMQTQLARADDLSWRLESEVDRALAAAQGQGGAEALGALRDRLRALRGEAEEEESPRVEDQNQERAAAAAAAVSANGPDSGARLLAVLQPRVEHLRQRLYLSPSPAAAETDRARVAAGGGDGAAAGAAGYRQADVVAGLDDVEVEVSKMRDENEGLMSQLVGKKIELAELQEEFLKTKRSLLRAVEKQALLSKKIDDMRDSQPSSAGGAAGGGGKGDGAGDGDPTPKRRMALYRAGRTWTGTREVTPAADAGAQQQQQPGGA